MFGSLILPIKPGGGVLPAGSCRRETLELIMQQTQATHHANTRSDAWHVDMSHSVWRVESVILSYMVRHVLRAPHSCQSAWRYQRTEDILSVLQHKHFCKLWPRNFEFGSLLRVKCGFHLQIVSITPGSELSPLWAEEGLTVSCYVSQLQRSRPRPIITSDGRQRLQPVPAEILILDNVEKSWWWGADVWGTAPWGPLPLSSAPDCNRSVRWGHGRQKEIYSRYKLGIKLFFLKQKRNKRSRR